MMTIMAALLGGLPLALATASGAELGRPLGLTIVGGLTPPGRNTTRLGFIVFRDRESLLDLLDFFWRVFSEGPLQIRGESAEEVAGRV
jgi:HAE1 family hydrophobic/amphiphilic exporter-1